MIPLAENPVIVLLMSANGVVVDAKTNVAMDLRVIISPDLEEFKKAAEGVPYTANLEH